MRHLPVLLLAVFFTPFSQASDSGAGMGPGVVRPNGTIFLGADVAVRADISPPLRDIPAKPVPGGKAEVDDPEPMMRSHGPQDAVDPVAQHFITPGEMPSAMPAPNVTFQGFANSCGGCAPPDPNGDIGPNHYVAMANSTIAVYSRAGAVLLSPRNINTIWTGFGGACENENAGDPVVLHDQFANRWLISQFTAAGPTYYNCVALSTTADPTGAWQRYAFTNGNSFGDYPKYGIWRDGYYFTTRNTSGSTGQTAQAINRTQMLAGSLTPTHVSILLPPGGTPYYGGDGILPADIDGNTLPPAGSPEVYIGSMDNGGPYGAPQDALTIYRFTVDWATPANSTFVRGQNLPVAAFNSTFTPCGGTRACIGQSGTTNKIDILSYRQRVIFRAAYRNFGTHESIVTNQSVEGANLGAANAIAGVRWYEIRNPNGTPTLYQQGTYAPGATDNIHRWMGSVAMDRVGNIAIGYSASNASMFPGIRYTGRFATDALGTMPQGEGILFNGAGSQTGGGNRWGDYTSLNVDPTDDCTFWYINEFYTATSSATWRIGIGSFTFPNCLCAATPPAPVATGATASAPNRLTVAWNDSTTASITRYYVMRANAAGGPYTQLATVNDTSPGVGGGAAYAYNDDTVVGGFTYYYRIVANDGGGCTSPDSNTVNGTATGACLLAPTFAGASAAANAGQSSCAIDLSWSAGAKSCPLAANALTYNIYRATAAGFTPSAGNRIAAGVSGTSYRDSGALTDGTTYYYVVRAVDSLGNEDANLVERSTAPRGPSAGTTTYASTDVPKSIPDNTPAGAASVVTVSGNANTVTDVNLTLNVTHPRVGQLAFTLAAPNATVVALVTNRGGNNANFTNTVFDDSAATAISAGTAPFTGSFQPESSLAAVTGIPANGTWTLTGVDGTGGQPTAGSITGWSIAVTSAAVCTSGARPVEVTPNGAPGAMLATKGSTAGTVVLNFADMPGATGYNVYEGALPIVSGAYTHGATGSVCNAATTLAGGRRTTAAAGIGTAGSHYYLVTQYTTAEGPSGFDSSAVEIDPAKNTCAP